MKTILFSMVFAISTAAVAAPTTLVCQSADFNPARQQGQSLILNFNEAGQLTQVSKEEGSWYCNHVSVQNPTVVSQTAGYVTYGVDFQCGELNGLLTLSKKPATEITSASYEFSFDEDDYFRTSNNDLVCVAK